MTNKVFLIGGAPGAGKTTLGFALAKKLGIRSLTIDDLVTAVIAITTPETHPGLHAMRKMPHVEYFTNSSLEQLKIDATHRHEATLPMVERIIRKYIGQDLGIVIDGWHLRPKWIAELQLDNVFSSWIVTTNAVLKEREKKNIEFFRESLEPDKMFDNFLRRSLWYNNLIKKQAAELQMNILYQTGEISVDDLCRQILEKLS